MQSAKLLKEKKKKKGYKNRCRLHQTRREALFVLFQGGDSGALSSSVPLSSEEWDTEMVSSSLISDLEPASSSLLLDSERPLTDSSVSLVSTSSLLKIDYKDEEVSCAWDSLVWLWAPLPLFLSLPLPLSWIGACLPLLLIAGSGAASATSAAGAADADDGWNKKQEISTEQCRISMSMEN